jgi:hypothetical protein
VGFLAMTREEKQLLLKDLCARLPYGVKVKCEKYSFPVTVLYAGNLDEVKFKETGGIEHIDLIKPYLRSMSSMTGVEVLEYISLKESIVASDDITYSFETYESIDWLNTHHFDYRGLIEKGLALEAKEGMYE